MNILMEISWELKRCFQSTIPKLKMSKIATPEKVTEDCKIKFYSASMRCSASESKINAQNV